MHGSDAQCLLDFILMNETDFLERETAPRVQRRGELVVLPKTRVSNVFSVDETKVEEGIEVCQLIVDIARLCLS